MTEATRDISPLAHPSAKSAGPLGPWMRIILVLGVGGVCFVFGYSTGETKGFRDGSKAGRDQAYRENEYLLSFERDLLPMKMKQLRAEIAEREKSLLELENVAKAVAAQPTKP